MCELKAADEDTHLDRHKNMCWFIQHKCDANETHRSHKNT